MQKVLLGTGIIIFCILYSAVVLAETIPEYGWDFNEGEGTATQGFFDSKNLSFVCGDGPFWSSDVPVFGDGVTTGGPYSIKIGGTVGDGKLHTTGIKPSDYPSGFTLNMWLKGTGLAIDWHSLPGVNYANWHVQVSEVEGGTLRWQVGCGSETCPRGTYHDRNISGTGWDQNTWAMVTIMQNLTHDCGYINGELLGCFATDHFAGHRDDLMLGGERFPADCRSSFDGNIDHVRIYTNPGGLSEREIKNLYMRGTTEEMPLDIQEKIFFSSDYANPGEYKTHLWMVDPTGSELTQLTFGDTLDSAPVLSPNGRYLAFSRSHPSSGDCVHLWMLDLQTGIEIPITVGSDGATYASRGKAWSPDGKELVFARGLPNPGCAGWDPDSARIWRIQVFPIIGSPAMVSPASGDARLEPDWSPDGKNIIHMTEVSGFNPFAIYKTTVNTHVEGEIIPRVGGEYDPEYSPAGTKIAWTSFRHDLGGHGDVYLGNSSDPDATACRVTPSTGYNSPSWNPDGTKFVMVKRGTGNIDLAIGDAECGAATPTVIVDFPIASANIPSWSVVTVPINVTNPDDIPPEPVFEILDIQEKVYDTEEDGHFDVFSLEIVFSMPVSGTFDVDTRLRSNVSGPHKISISAYSRAELIKGNNTLQLNFSGVKMYNSHLDSFFLRLIEFELEDAENNIPDYEVAVDYSLYNTSTYSYRDFQPPYASFTGKVRDYGLDSDGDGEFNNLIFEVEVWSAQNKDYFLNADIDFANTFFENFDNNDEPIHLDEGNNFINISLNGRKIHDSGLYGNFELEYLDIVDRFHGTQDQAIHAHTTSVYNYSQFQSPINFSSVGKILSSLQLIPKSFTIAVGRKGLAEDVIAATTVALFFQQNITENCTAGENLSCAVGINYAIFDDEVSDVYAQNVLAIGGAEENEITKKFLPRSLWPLGEGNSIIASFNHHGIATLLVAGNTPSETRKAAEVVVTKDFPTDASCLEISGTHQESDLEVDVCSLDSYFAQDADNDGIPNREDFIRGDDEDMTTNMPNVTVLINGSGSMNVTVEGIHSVRILNGYEPLVEFNFDFGNNTLLDFTSLRIMNQSTNTTGALLISGIELPEGITKTVYLERVDSSLNGVCIIDREILWINETNSSCNGEGEVLVECDGTSQQGYACTLNATSNKYKIAGLQHSAVRQVDYAKPPVLIPPPATNPSQGSSGSGGGGGGGGGGGAFYVCRHEWQCGEWSSCDGNGWEVRECTWTQVAQHAQSTRCHAQNSPPNISRKCVNISVAHAMTKLNFTAPEQNMVNRSVQTQQSEDLSSITGAVAGEKKIQQLLSNQKAVRELKIGVFMIIVLVVGIFGFKFYRKKKIMPKKKK